MKAVIYTRVSSKEQVEGTSLESQERVCRDYCAAHGLNVVRIFSDAGESAKTSDREQFLAAIRFCGASREGITHLVVWKLDRFARNGYDQAVFHNTLASHGVDLCSATQHLGEGMTAKILRTVYGLQAELENDIKAERSLVAMKQLALAGCWVHMAPVGYVNARDAQKRPVLIEDPQTGAVVRSAFEQISSGAIGVRAAVDKLLALGIKTPRGRTINLNDLHRMLRMPIYAGRIVSKLTAGREVRTIFPGLVSDETFDRVQAVLAGRSVTSKPHERTREDLPLKGTVRCGHCNNLLTASISRGRSASYGYYHCWKCGAVRVRADELERQMAELLGSLTIKTSPVMRLFKEIVLDVWKKEQATTQAETSRAKDNLTRIEQQMERLTDKLLSGVVTDDVYQATSARLRTEIAIARSAQHDTEIEDLDVGAAVEMATHLLADARRIWERLGAVDKARFQQALIPAGFAYTRDGGLRTVGAGNVFGLIPISDARAPQMAPLTGFEPMFPG